MMPFQLNRRRPEGGKLDLNNLPEADYGILQAVEESSTTTAASTESARFKKKKNGGSKEGSAKKVYECRFCSLKFCKSQALGGHMNRHRQERETETLNRARQLVYSNEGLPATGVHLGFRDVNAHGGAAAVQLSGYPTSSGDQYMQFQPLYSPHQYHNSVRGDYYIGHVLPGIAPRTLDGIETSYTCFGAPLISHQFPDNRIRPPTNGDAVPGNQIEGMNWNCNYGIGQHSDIDPSFP